MVSCQFRKPLYLVVIKNPPVFRLVQVHLFPLGEGDDLAAEEGHVGVRRNVFLGEDTVADGGVEIRLVHEDLDEVEKNGQAFLKLFNAGGGGQVLSKCHLEHWTRHWFSRHFKGDVCEHLSKHIIGK